MLHGTDETRRGKILKSGLLARAARICELAEEREPPVPAFVVSPHAVTPAAAASATARAERLRNFIYSPYGADASAVTPVSSCGRVTSWRSPVAGTRSAIAANGKNHGMYV